MIQRREIFFKTADLHIHGKPIIHNEKLYDDGELTGPEMVDAAECAGLSVVAYTAHNRQHADTAVLYSKVEQKTVTVVRGSEITTLEPTGERYHVLGLGIHTAIPPQLPMAEAIFLIRKQGGLAVIAHPTQRKGEYRDPKTLLEIMRRSNIRFDGIETNNGMLPKQRNLEAKRLQREHPHLFGAEVGGTDAHKTDVGLRVTVFPGIEGGNTQEELFEAIRQRTTTTMARRTARSKGLLGPRAQAQVISHDVFLYQPPLAAREFVAL